MASERWIAAWTAVAALSLATTSPAQTNVGGAISGNVTWTLAGSPYTLTSAVALSSNATLTVQAGVTVKVGLNMGITASTAGSSIHAMGTEASPILFTSTVQPVTAGHWRSLTLGATGTAASELHYARIEGGGRTNTVSLIATAAAGVQMDHVVVAARNFTGVQLASSSTFTSSTVESGNGIGVSVTGGGPTIEGCTIAGSATASGVSVLATTSGLQITNSTIQHGLAMTIVGTSPVLTGNTFADYDVGPGFRLHPQLVSSLFASNTVQGATAGSSKVAIPTGGTITSTATWPGYVYVLEGSLISNPGASGSWTLQAGTTLKMPSAASITVSGGSLLALGNGTSPVVFTSNTASPVAGTWRGLVVGSAQPSELRYTRIEGGGQGGYTSLEIHSDSAILEAVSVGVRANRGILLASTDANVTGCLVEPGPAIGIWVAGGSPVIDGCTIAGSPTARGLSISSSTGLTVVDSTIQHGLEIATADPAMLMSGNTFVDYPVGLGFRLAAENVSQVLASNTVQGLTPSASVIGVVAGTMSSSATWPNLIYDVGGNTTFAGGPTGVWTLEAGAQLRVANALINVSTGSLHAMGTATDRVVFTSDLQPAVAGRWRGLSLDSSGQPSELHDVRIEGGGASSAFSLSVNTDSVVDHVSVGVRGAAGILMSGAMGTSTGGVVEAGPGIGLTISGSPTLEGWTIAANSPSLGVSVTSGSVTIRSATIQGGIKANNATLQLRDSTVSQSAGIGLECTGSVGTVQVTGTQFQNNATVGISCGSATEIARNTITGSPVGIRITDVDPQLRLRNNNLAGLTTPLQNQDATTGVDARLNWWGTTSNPASLISGAAISNPWLGAAFVGPFEVKEALATPVRFAPGSNSTTFVGTFSESASWSLSISDPSQLVVRSFSGSASSLSQAWSGNDANEVVLGDATYSFALNASGTSGSAAPVLGEVVLDDALVTVKLTSPAALQYVPGPTFSVQGNVNGAVTSYRLSYAVGAAPIDSQFVTLATGTTSISGAIANWATQSMTQGIYTLRLEANTGAPSQARDEATVSVLVASGVTTTTYFSPNADGTQDTSSFAANLSLAVPWLLQAINSGSQVVREWSGSTTDADAVWDGRNAGGTLQSDGTYAFRLTFPSIPTFPPMASTSTVLDVTQPVAVITAPLDGLTVLDYQALPFTGTATDANLLQSNLTIAPSSDPTSTTTFASFNTPVVSGTLGTLDVGDGVSPAFANGAYQVELDVRDRAGNHGIVTRALSIDELRITSVFSTPEVIDPTANQTATIGFTLDRPANVSLRLYQSVTHALRRTLLDAEPEASGSHTFSWDGRNDASAIVQPEAYYFSIHASDGAGRSVTYNEPTSPTLGPWQWLHWSNVLFNGVAPPNVFTFPNVDWNPHRNDPLLIEFDTNGPARHRVTAIANSTIVYILSWAPVPTGHYSVLWDGRDGSGSVLSTTFGIGFTNPMPVEIHPIFVKYGTDFGDVRTNPYLFHPTLAEVTNLKYSIGVPSQIGIDVIDPNGSFLDTLMSPTAQPAGAYELIWDGRDADGEIVTAAGSYTLVLTGTEDATGRAFTRRATVLVAP